MGIFHGHPTTHRDPTADTRRPSSHARGRERSIARKNLARPMRARRRRRRRRCDGSLRRHSATGRRDAGDASERGGVRTRRDLTVRQDASRPCSSTTTTTRAGPADAHHTRRASTPPGGRARAHRIASHPSIHPSFRRVCNVDATRGTCSSANVRMREKGCAPRRASRAGRARAVVSEPASIRRCRGAGDVSTSSRDSFIRVTRATSCVRARWAGATMNRCMTRRRSRVRAWTSRMRVAHGTARHGAARGCARPQTPTSAVV